MSVSSTHGNCRAVQGHSRKTCSYGPPEESFANHFSQTLGLCSGLIAGLIYRCLNHGAVVEYPGTGVGHQGFRFRDRSFFIRGNAPLLDWIGAEIGQPEFSRLLERGIKKSPSSVIDFIYGIEPTLKLERFMGLRKARVCQPASVRIKRAI